MKTFFVLTAVVLVVLVMVSAFNDQAVTNYFTVLKSAAITSFILPVNIASVFPFFKKSSTVKLLDLLINGDLK